MYYEIVVNCWDNTNGGNWKYVNDVIEKGEANSLDEFDMQGYLIEMFKDGYVPHKEEDLQYVVSLYADKEFYTGGGEPIDTMSVWESEIWKNYHSE